MKKRLLSLLLICLALGFSSLHAQESNTRFDLDTSTIIEGHVIECFVVEEVVSTEASISFEKLPLLGVRYLELIPILIEANKDREAEIENLKQYIEELKRLLIDNEEQEQAFEASLEAVKPGRLIANAPNPFEHRTSIYYELDAGVNNAAIRIVDLQGQEVSYHRLVPNGRGVLDLEAKDLKPGTLVYILSVEGQDIDSKIMLSR